MCHTIKLLTVRHFAQPCLWAQLVLGPTYKMSLDFRYEKVTMTLQLKWRQNVVGRVCPGCVYGWQSKRVPRYCRPGTFQNLAFKSMLGTMLIVINDTI